MAKVCNFKEVLAQAFWRKTIQNLIKINEVVACCAVVGGSRDRGWVGAGLKTVLSIPLSFYRSYWGMERGSSLQGSQNWWTCFLNDSYLGLDGILWEGVEDRNCSLVGLVQHI